MEISIQELSEKMKLNEASNRYSVEVNYRTHMKEVIDGFARLALGFVSSAMKQRGYHVKQVFDQPPFRVIVSSQNWLDGEWVLAVSYNPEMKCFIISKGWFNKDRDTMTLQSNEKCSGHSAAEIYKQMFNKMAKIKDEPPHHHGGLKGIKGKTGPVTGSTRPAQKYTSDKEQIKPKGEDRMGM